MREYSDRFIGGKALRKIEISTSVDGNPDFSEMARIVAALDATARSAVKKYEQDYACSLNLLVKAAGVIKQNIEGYKLAELKTLEDSEWKHIGGPLILKLFS